MGHILLFKRMYTHCCCCFFIEQHLPIYLSHKRCIIIIMHQPIHLFQLYTVGRFAFSTCAQISSFASQALLVIEYTILYLYLAPDQNFFFFKKRPIRTRDSHHWAQIYYSFMPTTTSCSLDAVTNTFISKRALSLSILPHRPSNPIHLLNHHVSPSPERFASQIF